MRIRVWTATAVGLLLLGLGGAASADEKMIGSLAAIDVAAKTLTVQETGAGESTTFAIDDETQIREGRKDIALTALTVGRSVKVTFAPQGGAAPLARRIEMSVELGGIAATPSASDTDAAK
jgi:hypothetical protein